jgi:dTDP-4-dehydrorhamnose 3,5-epimerase
MRIQATAIPGVLIIEPNVFGDERGFFLETYHQARFEAAGLPSRFVQANHSRSKKGVLRGLHYQLVQPQGKLVSVLHGAVFDVAVDIRQGSPTFGLWVGTVLDDLNHCQLYIPPGFAHGFEVLSDEVDFFYQCTDYYHPASERGIAWDDPSIGIDWPLKEVLLSEKDRQNPRLAKQKTEFLPFYDAAPLATI